MRFITERNLNVSVIILTMYDEEEMFRKAVELGVMGYILKESAAHEIVQGITVVARGECYYSPMLAARALRSKENKNGSTSTAVCLESLTATEKRILSMIADYKSTSEISDALCVSQRTVEHHREHICQKLNLTGRYALVRFALEQKAMIHEQ